ncbi:MAG TPA: xanthine dehydrogenase family protein molybdopterin-binding subunit [Xanthobacteraceae bacterium]|nr:xanthine dehydrogenase family protein molybdopterin-binding subunit [Xanthobacteraceae bacterium]
MIGRSVPRIEDEPLLRGRARFVDDIELPGLLHASFVRSPHAHAAIRGIDVSRAAAAPGIRAVLTLTELSAAMRQRRMRRHSNSGTALDLVWPFALADKEVSYVGEPVAIVLGESRYLAEDAAALVDVTYEVMEPAVDCRLSEQATSPPVRTELKSNVVATYKVGYGDAEQAFKNAAHVFEEEIVQCRGGAHSIEGRGIVVEYRSGDDSLLVSASTQKAHDLKNSIAVLLGLPDTKIRVITPEVGGGFGAKLCVYSEDIAAAAAAKLLKRSIKWIEDRREHFTNAVQERDQIWRLAIATDKDGVIAGIRGTLIHDQGAYALQDVNLPYNSASAVTGPYVVPSFAMDVRVVLTNKTPVSSVRGAGYPQSAFAMERLMDLVAAKLKLDRADVRQRNLIAAEDMPYEKPVKARSGVSIVYDTGDYPATQKAALDAGRWHDFAQRKAQARAAGRYIGIGIANAVKGTGRGPFESGLVRIDLTGQVSVYTGAAPMGQGLRTALAQICAGEFGLSASDINVVAGDTGPVPLGLGGFASRQLITAGSSVLLASRAVAAKAKTLAGRIIEADESDLELSGGTVHVAGAKDANVSLGELARILNGAPGYGFPAGMEPGLDAMSNFRTDALAYANASHIAEVEVDRDTGGITLVNYVAVQDAGRLINPMIVDGQIKGGIVHGIGNAIFEHIVHDGDGQPLATNFADYLLPTATELPPMQTFYTESPTQLNPLGAKGVGEVGTIPAAAAIISAIEDALSEFSIRISQVPISPHFIRARIEQAAR